MEPPVRRKRGSPKRRFMDVVREEMQETKWKGSTSRNIGGGFKLFYHGVDGKKNGVGVILKKEYSKSVVEVKRVSDRVMNVNLEVEGMMINVMSDYAPQVGCEMEEKERFWSELDEVVDGVPRKERLVIGADFIGHVGEGNRGDEEVMGRYGLKGRNVEGQMVVDFAKRMEMAVVNTYFKKKEDHRVTYKSGERCTQVDYVLCRRCNLKEIEDCKVLAGDSVARQHRMVVCRMALEAKKKEGKKMWWWNEEVQESIRRKRLAKQKWDRQSDEKSRQEYKVMRLQVKRDVAKAKEKTYEKLYERLDTKEGEKDLYRLSRQRDRAGKDVLQVRAIKDGEGNVLTSKESVLRRWREYLEQLMNEENQSERRLDDVELVKEDVDRIRGLRGVEKTVGPDDIPVEAWRCLGEMAVEFLARLFNKILEAFNTIIPQHLIEKLNLLGLNTSLCNWILDFLTERPQSVRIGNSISSTTTLSTGAPQGCVFSPLLFTLLTYDCVAMHSSNYIIKFTDDTTVVGLISKNDESAYREKVQRLTAWCGANNLSLNLDKTKEMVVDFRRAQSDQSPLIIDGSSVEIVKSTKFLGVHLADNLTWSLNTSSITKKAQQRLYFLRRLRKAHLPPPILSMFYRGTIESILSITAWFGNCTVSDRKSLQRIVRTAEKIIGISLPSIMDIYTTRCIRKAHSIVDDHTHPSHTLFTLLPSGKRETYDRVPREELWYCMRKSGVSEKYVRVVEDMYEDSVTAVKCAVGTTDWFRVRVGLHQGSALSPFLFAVLMDRLTDEVRQESPWTMMFADDIVICGESNEQVEIEPGEVDICAGEQGNERVKDLDCRLAISVPGSFFYAAMMVYLMQYVVWHCHVGKCKVFPERDDVWMGAYVVNIPFRIDGAFPDV
ncbi:gastrula zinc finger protein XlCGF28.1-like [Silurus asotus]|uniref:Gastrula zinc finger protein XlCGF28.1-like n=1 Tax=Silurus asotus TaxID=30991 RepID=A0AAD5FN04_SILAS|nr:gastrula zinc finger protein XlCGF28.1-like [Silurus asotus]